MKHPTSIALHAHWEACATRGLPELPALNLQALGAAVTNTFTIEPPLRSATYGFCGAALALRYGRDLAGESFLARWSADDRAALERHVFAMAAGSSGIVFGMTAETAAGGFTTFELLLLPVRHASAVGAVGSMARIGGHDDGNRIRARIVAQFLRSVRVLPPRSSQSERNLPEIGGAPRPAGRNYGHLRLVAGGK